jgi:hypothetical protein
MLLILTQDQRDGLLVCCDCCDNPSSAAVADDLILPDRAGSYAITLPQDVFVQFLEHELHLMLQSGLDERWLRAWHACVTLLDDLGHEVDGSVYEEVACHCPGCLAEGAHRAQYHAALRGAESEEDKQRISREFFPRRERSA